MEWHGAGIAKTYKEWEAGLVLRPNEKWYEM